MEILHLTHKSSSADFIPRVQPQNSAPTQFWVQVLASRLTTWFKAKMPGLSWKTNATKNLSKSSPSPSPLLLTTRSAELKLSALKKRQLNWSGKWDNYNWYFCSCNLHYTSLFLISRLLVLLQVTLQRFITLLDPETSSTYCRSS